jgi:hypothetical protein
MLPTGVFYKEHDDFHPWRGQWDNNKFPVYILKKDADFNDPPLQASPKLKIQELLAIEQHWDKIMEVIREVPADEVPAEEQDGPLSDGADSEADSALLEDTFDKPALAPAPIGNKWHEGDAWWKQFATSEKEFWKQHPADTTECPHPPLTEGDEPYVQLPHILKQKPLPTDQKQMSVSLLSAFDTLDDDLPPCLDSSIASKLVEAKKVSRNLNKELGQAANTLHLYSSQGTKPENSTHYNATTDLQVGDIAVIKVAVEESSGRRGWDVVRVIRMDEGNVDCLFLMPSIKTLKYTATHYPDWPPNWMDYKMQPIKVTKHKQWAGKITSENVQFSFPCKGDKIPGKYIHSVQMACIAITNSSIPDALESDADVPS